MEPVIRLIIDSLVFPPETDAILRDIDLTINQGDFVAITGESAAGKSMLLHCITGAAVDFFHGQLNGKVAVMGQDIAQIPLPAMCDYIGYMMQEAQNQIVSITVEEEVAFGIANMNLPWEEIQKRTQDCLQFVGLEELRQRNTGELSGGQAQRAVLASVLAMETPILVLDQPTAELDGQGKRDLYAHIAYLNTVKGVTVVMVMDRACDILPYANRVVIMANGTITEECSPAAYQERLRKKEIPQKTIVTSTKNVIEAQDLSFVYKGGFTGCQNISFAVQQGDFIGLIGLNGSGKTTLLKLLEGLLTPDGGALKLFGEPLTKKSLPAVRSRIGFLFQNPDLQIFASTVRDEAAFILKARKCAKQDIEEKVSAILSEVGLASCADLHPHRLSRSQRQKLAIASMLVGEPEIIIADEPTSGLDEEQSAVIMELLSEFQQRGKTIVLVTHDLGLAQRYTNRIMAMHKHGLELDIPTKEIIAYSMALKEIGLDIQQEGVANGFH